MPSRSKTMLVDGEIDAVMAGAFIKPFLDGDPNVGRLFPDYKKEEQAYYKKTGIFPIMHVMGIRQEIVDEHPWVTINLYRAFDEAKSLAMKRMANPRLVPLAWYRSAWEEQEEILGKDPWEYGLTEAQSAQSQCADRIFLRAGTDPDAFAGQRPVCAGLARPETRRGQRLDGWPLRRAALHRISGA